MSEIPEQPEQETGSLVDYQAMHDEVHGDGEDVEGKGMPERQYTAEEQETALGGWLERRGIDPSSTPRFTMGRKEYDLFRNAPSDYQAYVTRTYDIPHDDQDNCQFVFVNLAPDDSSQANDLMLVDVTGNDFGTSINLPLSDEDFQTANPDPQNPPMPELSGGVYRTVDIGDTLATSARGLQTFAAELMNGRTTNPFSEQDGSIGIRAGGLADGQQDAYVWTVSPFSKSVELTIAFPGQYDSVCIVQGQRREAANGKAGMAQIVGPTEVLKIEGEHLKRLQKAYQELYSEPNFALSREQRQARDATFNDYLAHQISQEASSNREREQTRRHYENQRRQQPPLRAREIPRS